MSKTLKDIRDQLKDELDMVEEQWLDDPALDRMINSAIAKANRKILTIYEDYFLSNHSVEIASGDSLVDYPADIYANKIRNITYVNAPIGGNGSVAIEVKPVRRLKDAVAYNALHGDVGGQYSRSWLPYDAEDTRKIKLMPETGVSGRLDMWYIREAKKLVNDTDVCDIDEFADYVVQVAKVAFYRYDGDPRYREEKGEELELEKSMVDTLTNMKDDENNEVVADLSFYRDCL